METTLERGRRVRKSPAHDECHNTQVGASGPSPGLEWAARLVVSGVNVIPIGADKRPLGPWKRWQSEHQINLPYPADDEYLLGCFELGGNVAAVTGSASGFVVLDADSRTAWDALQDVCGGTIPRTVVVNTARGRHVWFAHPGGEIRNTVRLGKVPLDVRGDGGYVLVPPSIHPTGTPYTWHRSPLEIWPPAQISSALLQLLRPRGSVSAVHRFVSSPSHAGRGAGRYARAALERELAAVRGAPVGVRNDTLNRAAFALARFVFPGELAPREVADQLLTAAEGCGLTTAEARRTIASGLKARDA